jgi:hypothetical protein
VAERVGSRCFQFSQLFPQDAVAHQIRTEAPWTHDPPIAPQGSHYQEVTWPPPGLI